MQRKNLITGLVVALSLCGCGADDEGPGTATGSGGQTNTGSGGATAGAGGSGIAGRPAGSGGATAGSGGKAAAGTGGVSAGTGGTGGMSAGSGGMSAGSGGMSSGSGGTSAPTGGSDPTMLPTAPEPCPMLSEGASTVTILGTMVNIWVGAKSESQKGPIYIWWHGTGGNGMRGNMSLGGNAAEEVLAQGGIIAAPNGTTKMGIDTCNAVWYTGDFGIADEIVACAIEQLNIDTRRIYTGGASAGGLQAGAMAYGRSGYLAAAVPNSGGISPRGGLKMWQDMAHPPAMMTMHGAMGTDVVSGLDFATSSLALDDDLVAAGGFAIDCDHGGGHVRAPADLTAASWDFLKAHPYGTKPSPYAGGLPDNFPDYCTIIE